MRVKWTWCPSPAYEINSRLLSQWDATTVLDSVPPAARTASFSTSTVPQHLAPFLAALKGGSEDEAEDGDGNGAASSAEDAPVQRLLKMKIAELMWWLFVAAGPYAGLSFLRGKGDEDDVKKKALFIYLAPAVLDLAAAQKGIVERVFISPRSKQKEKMMNEKEMMEKKAKEKEKDLEDIRLAPERREAKCLKYMVRRLVEYGCAAREQEHCYPSVALVVDRCLALLLNLIYDRHSRRWAYPQGTHIITE